MIFDRVHLFIHWMNELVHSIQWLPVLLGLSSRCGLLEKWWSILEMQSDSHYFPIGMRSETHYFPYRKGSRPQVDDRKEWILARYSAGEKSSCSLYLDGCLMPDLSIDTLSLKSSESAYETHIFPTRKLIWFDRWWCPAYYFQSHL